MRKVLNFVIGYWLNQDNKIFSTVVIRTSERSIVAREFKKLVKEKNFLPTPFKGILTDEELDRVIGYSSEEGVQVIEFVQKDKNTFVRTVR